MNTPTFITGNPGKAEQLSKYVGIEVEHKKVDLHEIQSVDLEEIVEKKVKEAFKLVEGPVIVDDTGFVINEMGTLPGPFIKFFIDEMGNEKICDMVSYFEDKTAAGIVCIGYYDGENLETFLGEIKGTISEKPKGKNGFGWDEIFIPDGYEQTRSEMNDKDYESTNPRIYALDKLSEYFKRR